MPKRDLLRATRYATGVVVLLLLLLCGRTAQLQLAGGHRAPAPVHAPAPSAAAIGKGSP
jgi:hypothetical protein